MHKALYLRVDINGMFQEIKEEENIPTLRIVWMQQIRDLKNIKRWENRERESERGD